jgi:hypothetical protein
MLSVLATPAYAPFAIAFVVMIGIGLIEAIGLGLGHLDLHGDLEGDAGGGTALDWLGLGDGLPILIWLTSLLACFAVVGVGIQQVATAIGGAPLDGTAAALGAVIPAMVLNAFTAHGLARIMPGYESTVISQDSLLTRRAIVLEGSARRGHPARAKVIDQHRQAHYVMIEPHRDGDVIAQGDTVLLVRKDGPTFFALPDEHSTLRPI